MWCLLFCGLWLIPTALAADGAPFFLLSDTAFGSGDLATVRLEMRDLANVPEYGGVDVYVYRVEKPLEFLKAQKNLHRINVKGDYAGESVANALTRIWDNWWVESRAAWRRIFTTQARMAVTAQAPGVRTHPLERESTSAVMNPKYRPLSGHTLVDSFRYPLHLAKPIKPPRGLKLEGSSSEFFPQDRSGRNVMIPLGKRAPGLYLVEVMAGDHRAVTLVFVSDALAVTKVSGQQMLVWVAQRQNGQPMAQAKTVWSDGVGVLAEGVSDARGVVNFQRTAPEKTYVFGQDAQGGVFVAENYYYDSEVYNTKLYATTDRPLYRPGETVFVKFVGRTFQSARTSVPLAAGDIKLQVLDANGFPVASKTVPVTAQGGDTSFQLPEQAAVGGYELRFEYKGNLYGAAFRVAEYQKPHFEVRVLPAKPNFKTGEPIRGKLQLFYPDGKPVANAQLDLNVRTQRVSMIEGDLGYAGQFPLNLPTTSLVSNARGEASFELPAASEPSRYILSVLARDGASFRVHVSKELLVERASDSYQLRAERVFSAAGETVTFAIQALATGAATAPVSWDWVRLENRQKANGRLAAPGQLALNFAQPGTYTVSLRDAAGNVLGATAHYVSGGGLSAPQGAINMVFDKRSYQPGETAHALVTFPQPVVQALFTLERDKVEKNALLTEGGDWVRPSRISPTQWRVDMPVRADYGPNITLSVVTVQNGEYVFQNLGMKVAMPHIDVAVKSDKAVYAPGDKVTLDLSAQVAGKVAPGTLLTVGVVDEMVYVLQPEIAPDIEEFFYHPRRNNVRTTASVSFIGYDLARPPSSLRAPRRGQSPQRAFKLLERPRREDKDTALWLPTVKVDKQGRATVSFTMPDSLTRWRVTVRASAPSGTMGQRLAYVRSDKPFYVKWTSPNWLRAQDAPVASVAIFNQGQQEASAELQTSGLMQRRNNVRLKPGANFVALPLLPQGKDGVLNLALTVNQKTVDALSVPLRVAPSYWQNPHAVTLPLRGKDTALSLPEDARNIRVQLADNASSQLRRVMDDLIDYPYGCTEQTSSRLIPYSLALQSLSATDARLADTLRQQLYSARFRLAQLAGDQGTFGWWREAEPDPLLTVYAYYADWHASRSLQLALPNGHFERLLEVYRQKGVRASLWHRALMLSWMQEIGLPVRSLAEALLQDALRARPVTEPPAKPLNSAVLDDGAPHLAQTVLLTHFVVQQSKGNVPSELSQDVLGNLARSLQQADAPLDSALLMLVGRNPVSNAAAVLQQVRADAPTIDRALTLQWVYRALGGFPKSAAARSAASLNGPWQAVDSGSGQRLYRWMGTGVPRSLNLAAVAPAGTVAVVQYDSRDSDSGLPGLQLERKLYRLVMQVPAVPANRKPREEWDGPAQPDAQDYLLELLPPDAVLHSDALYLDEIVLKAQSAKQLRYGIVEAPLPPGAVVERTTWGIRLHEGGHPGLLEKARHESIPYGYAIPVHEGGKKRVIRHLLRVGQNGRFTLPAARYYRMYQTEQKAVEAQVRGALEIR